MPSSDNVLQVLSPSKVRGTFTVIFFAIPCNIRPSANIVSKSVAVTSALTGPSTILQISDITSLISRPDAAINEGFVVTPSTRPVGTISFISWTFAVSKKNFM